MEEFKKALNYSFLLLKYRARSEREIIGRLKKKNFSLSAIKKTINFLKEKGYLNDSEFVSSFIREEIRKGFGKSKIYFKLKSLGVEEDIIKKKIDSIDTAHYKEKIKKIIEGLSKRYSTSKNKKGKIVRYLYQRGFALEDIIEILDEYR